MESGRTPTSNIPFHSIPFPPQTPELYAQCHGIVPEGEKGRNDKRQAMLSTPLPIKNRVLMPLKDSNVWTCSLENCKEADAENRNVLLVLIQRKLDNHRSVEVHVTR
jgi:hypothetical protein